MIRRIQEGDLDASNQFCEQYAPFILSILLKKGLKKEDAEDLVGEILLKALQSVLNGTLNRDESGFRSYLARMTLNKRIDFYRKHQMRGDESRSVPLDDVRDELSSSSPDPLAQVINGETIHQILSSLSEADRRAFLQFSRDGLTMKEIAEIEDASESAIKQRIFRARRAIIKVLINFRI